MPTAQDTQLIVLPPGVRAGQFVHVFRAGDVVHHKPSGETWQLAYREGQWVAPCGWPPCEARASDCVLVKAATDEEHRAMLEKWTELLVRARDRDEMNDRRPRVCFDQLWLLNEAFVGAYI